MRSLKFFKNYRVMFFVSLIIVLISSILGFVYLESMFAKLFILFICDSVLIYIYQHAIKRISEILDMDAYNSVAKYINEIAVFYRKQRYDECKVFLRPYLANGYFYIGDMESLKLMLDIGMEDKENLNYYYLYTCYNIEVGDLVSAKTTLKKFNELVRSLEENSADYLNFFEKQQICEAMLNYYSNDDFQETGFWKSLYDGEKKDLSRLRAGYYLAMSFLRNHDEINAKRVLKSVIENCSECIYGYKAAEALKSIDVEFEYISQRVAYTSAKELFN